MTAIDLYQQCPCRSGKKLKFCCGADIAHELESVYRAVEGQQRVVALDLAQRAVATKGPRPALLVLQIELAIANEKFDVAEAGLRELLRQKPKDPGTLGIRCWILAAKRDMRGAVDALHDALELIPEKTPVPVPIVRAYQQVGAGLFENGAGQAALAHFLAASQMTGHQDAELLGLIQRLNSAPELSTAIKEIPPLARAPEGAAWKASFDAAMQPAERGLWRKARNQFRVMAENLSQEPAILKNLAIMQAMLGDPKATAATWRVYSRLPNLPLDEAVDAELQAQVADPGESEILETMILRFPIKNVDACMEHLLSDRRCVSKPVEPSEWDPEDGPPPKAIFLLLDRPLPTAHAEINLAELPGLLGELYVFGKQTDRPAILEAEFDRDENYQLRRDILQAVAGEHLDSLQSEEVAATRAAAIATLALGTMFPKGVPTAKQIEITNQRRNEALLTRWIRVPLWECGGKSAQEAAQDPRQKIPLLAAILHTQLTLEQHGVVQDFNPLRQQLGLPIAEPIEASADLPVERIPITRLSRLRPESLSDQDLGRVIQRAVMRGSRGLQRQFALAAVERQAPESAPLVLAACEILAKTASDPGDAISWIEKGRQVAQAHQLPAGRLKVVELEFRIMRGEYDIFAGLLTDLVAHEATQDREVGLFLYSTMMRLGLVSEDGRMMIPTTRRATGPVGPAPGAPAGPAGGIWTPGSASSPPSAPAAPVAPAAPTGKSKLWLPGMD